MLSRRTLAVALLWSATARADVVSDAARLSRTLDTVLDVSYALRDPDAVWQEVLRDYDQLLQDPVAAALVGNVLRQYRGGYVGITATAGVTTDLDTPVAGNAAVDVAYQLPLCRVLGVNGSGLAGYADGDGLASWSLGGTACLPLPADTIQVSYTHRENVRTSLFSRPVVLTDRTTDDVVGIEVRPYRWLGEHNNIDVLPFDIGIDVSRDAQTSGFGTQVVTLDMSPTRWHRRGKGLPGADQTYEFVKFHLIFQEDDKSLGGRTATINTISPLTVDGIHLGPDVTFGADVGFLQAYADTAYASNNRLVSMNAAHSEVWIDTAVAPFGAELRATHTILPTYDGQLVRDNRIAATMQLATATYTARAAGFLGRDEILRNEPGGAKLGIAGGALDLAYAATRRVFLIGRVEAARTLAAGRAMDAVATQWDLRATVGVTTQFDARWPGAPK